MRHRPPPALDDLRRGIQRFVRAFGLLEADTRTPCGQPVSTSLAHALMALRERADAPPPPITWLGEHLGLDKSSASRLARRLEAEGHVVLEPCPDDARSRRLVLTAGGRRLAERLDTSSRERFARLLEQLGLHGASVLDALDHLGTALQAIHPGNGDHGQPGEPGDDSSDQPGDHSDLSNHGHPGDSGDDSRSDQPDDNGHAGQPGDADTPTDRTP